MSILQDTHVDDSMKKSEIIEIAKKYGIKNVKNKTKSVLIQSIKDKQMDEQVKGYTNELTQNGIKIHGANSVKELKKLLNKQTAMYQLLESKNYSDSYDVKIGDTSGNKKYEYNVRINPIHEPDFTLDGEEFYVDDFVRDTHEIIVEILRDIKRTTYYKKVKFILDQDVITARSGDEGTRMKRFCHAYRHNENNYLYSTINHLDDDINSMVEEQINTLQDYKDNYETKGSGHTFDGFGELRISVIAFNYNPGHLEEDIRKYLEVTLAHRKGWLNVEQDKMWSFDKCFYLNVVACYRGYTKASDFDQQIKKVVLDSYNRYQYNFDEYCRDIETIVTVFAEDDGDFYVVRRFGDYKDIRLKQINMLEINGNSKSPNGHLILITDTSEFFRHYYKQKGDNRATKYVCTNCALTFALEEKFEVHNQYCITNQEGGHVKYITPEGKDRILKYKSKNLGMHIPILIAMDYETEPNLEGIHEAKTFGIAMDELKEIGDNRKLLGCRAINCSEEHPGDVTFQFVEHALKKLVTSYKVPIGDYDKEEHKNADVCVIKGCSPIVNKVAHHDHKTGEYIGAACSQCNLHACEPKRIVGFFHNGERFDNIFHIKYLTAVSDKYGWELDSQKTISSTGVYLKQIVFSKKVDKSKYQFVILDSKNFMGSSLEKNVISNKKANKKFVSTFETFKALYPDLIKEYDDLKTYRLLGKTHMPHSTLGKYVRGNGDIINHNHEEFIEDLCNEEIKISCELVTRDYTKERKERCENYYKDLQHFVPTMDTYKCMEVYLYKDICHLLDCVRFYQTINFKDTEIDPYFFPTAHSFGFEAALKMSGVELELFDDPPLYREFKGNCFGGYSDVMIRELRSSPSTTIMELDATSMYPTCMQLGLLPTKLIDRVDNVKLTYDDFKNNYRIDGTVTFIRCDVEFPVECHEYLQKFPPRIIGRCYENYLEEIDSSFDYSKFTNQNQRKHSDKYRQRQRLVAKSMSKKLTADLYPSRQHLFLEEYTDLMIELGAVVSNITGVYIFEGTDKIGEYINTIGKQRADIKTEMDKTKDEGVKAALEQASNNKKLFMNSFYGKTIEDVENRTDNKLAVGEWKIYKNMCNPFYQSKVYLDDLGNLALIKRQKKSVCLNKPVFIGKTILDRSKCLMIRFIYKRLFPTFGWDNVRIGCTDTDSVHVAIDNHTYEDVCMKFKTQMADVMDLSKMKKGIEPTGTGGIFGTFKWEDAGRKIEVGKYWGPKMYYEKVEMGGCRFEKKFKNKGIPAAILRMKKDKILDYTESDYVTYNKLQTDHKTNTISKVKVTKHFAGYRGGKRIVDFETGTSVPYGFMMKDPGEDYVSKSFLESVGL